MHDKSGACWLREEITFAKWALLATWYPPESLWELGKVIAQQGLDRRPCFQEYTSLHETTLKSLELPCPWHLAAQCTTPIQVVSIFELGESNVSNYPVGVSFLLRGLALVVSQDTDFFVPDDPDIARERA